MASGPLNERARARGKENYPALAVVASRSPELHQWDPIDGTIVIKVSVPATDDIWRFKVPTNATYRAFRAKVELKVGFPVAFADGPSAQAKRVGTEEKFRRWVANRVKHGRNHPLVAFQRQQSSSSSRSDSYPVTPTLPLSPTLPSSPETPLSPPYHNHHDSQPRSMF
jgi:hypothetical protein